MPTSPEAAPHGLEREWMDCEGDQPIGWICLCRCGEEFDHIAPENAREQLEQHVQAVTRD